VVVCNFGFFNVWLFVFVCVLLGVVVCILYICNVCVSVCAVFLMLGCGYVWVL